MGVEIDLLFFLDHYLMVEVKSLSSKEHINFRLKDSQKKRLLSAREYFQSFKDVPVELLFAFVHVSGEMITLNAGDLL